MISEAQGQALPLAVASRSEQETEELGQRLGAGLSAQDVVYLRGALGAGKTALARGIAAGRGAQPRQVASPTFAILHEYAGENGEIVLRHLDLYRLGGGPTDLEILGLPDAVRGAPVVVEWPNDVISGILPATVEVGIDVLPDGSRRISRRSAAEERALP